VVLLCDPRLGLTELDELLLELIRPRVEEGLKFLLLLTKADKLTRVEANKALQIARLNAGGGEAQLFSALKRVGIEEANDKIMELAGISEDGAAQMVELIEMEDDVEPEAGTDKPA